MSLDQLKSKKDYQVNPKLDQAFSDGLIRAEQKQWRNTWSFHLNRVIPLNKQYGQRSQQYVKKFLRCYYGKKILYVTKPQEVNAIVSRSKLLKFVEIEKNGIKRNLKSKGNLVILVNDFLIHKEQQRNYYEEDDSDDDDLREDNHLLLKKIIKHCSKANIKIEREKNLKLPKYLLASKHISIRMGVCFELSILGEIVRNLLILETLRIETMKEIWSSKTKKTPKNRFFTLLHKLSRLESVKLGIYSSIILSSELEWDLEEFYSQPINFDLSIKICMDSKFGEERYFDRFGREKTQKISNLISILAKVEYLSFSNFGDGDESDSMVAKEEKRRLKLGMRNILRISGARENVNLTGILSNCRSLENLYVRQITSSKSLNNEPSAQIEGLKNLKVAVVEYSSSINQNEDPFLICSQIKENTKSLQHLSLYCEIWGGISLNCPKEISSAKEKWKRSVQGISTINNLKRFELLINPDNVLVFPLTDILSNRSLESFMCKLKFDYDDAEDLNCEWDPCFATADTSEIKKLSITIPKGRTIPLFGINFWNYIKKLDNLQVVELIDKNCGRMPFDFFYGFVTSLLEKKGLRKLMILTRVSNNFYSENSEMLLSSNFDAQFKNMMTEAARDWESRINELKDLQLEEIMIGKLEINSFNYIFYHKELQVVENFFWTEKEIHKRLQILKTELSEQVLDFLKASGVYLDYSY